MRRGRLGPAHPLPVIALVLLAHALLGLWLSEAVRPAPREAATGQRATALRLIAVRALPPASPQQPAPGRSAGARSVAPRTARPPIENRPVPMAPADATPLVSEAAPPAASNAPAAAPALPALLDSEATRRALRQAAREPPPSERAAALLGPAPETTQQRLGREIGQSATGECLQGEYAGGGMGLLSLPFWLLAEARGKCRR